jgi:anti-anti-sigma regulatory factor
MWSFSKTGFRSKEEDTMQWQMEQQDKDLAILRLNGQLTVEYMGELRKVLLDAMAAAATVLVELGSDSEADIAGLQMLCSAHRTFVARGGKFALKQGTSEAFRRIVRDAALLRHQGCSLNPHDNCLWIGGNL